MSTPHVKDFPTSDIKPYSKNPRTRTKKQIELIAQSITEYGFNAPIVIDEDNVVINGHGRLQAAQHLGLQTVPVIQVSHLSEARKRAYRLADNKIAEMSQWDMELLGIELSELSGLELGGVDLVTGFATPEIDVLLSRHAEAHGPDVDADEAEPALEPPASPVSRVGDVWILGKHRVMCGDTRSGEDLAVLMDGKRARMAFTDPPYNVAIDGFVSGNGSVQHDEFAMASGEMTPDEFTQFLSSALSAIAAAVEDGAIIFCCMDWRHIDELSAAGRAARLRLMNLVVWVKTNAGMGAFYRSRHELIFVFKHGDAPHLNNFGLGQYGRHRTNVWEHRGANAFGSGRAEDLADHPTVKPVAMIVEAIKDVSKRGEIVLDVFGGSGSTLLAAEMTGRCTRLMEIEPKYVDVTIRRWQAATGKQAQLAATGRTFEEVASDREPPLEPT